MEIEYYGANCFKIVHKKANLIIDDNLADLGGKSITKDGDIAVFTAEHGLPKAQVKLLIDQPGEYEVSNISVIGTGARSLTEEEDQKSATIYKIVADDIKVAVLGHIYPELTDTQLETLGTIDILLIPVGGNGYTMDAVGALKVIKKIEPKLVVPSHHADKQLKYPVPQQELNEAIKGLSMEPKERISKLKLKANELMTDGTQLVILEKQ